MRYFVYVLFGRQMIENLIAEEQRLIGSEWLVVNGDIVLIAYRTSSFTFSELR